jgi:hypothetical protein
MLVAVSAMTVLSMSLVLFEVMIMFVPIVVMTMLTMLVLIMSVIMIVMIVMVVNVSMMLLHFNPPGANIELLLIYAFVLTCDETRCLLP